MVKENIRTAVASGVHVEVTNLVVNGLNDHAGPFTEMVDWLTQVSDQIPLHISRYFPRHRETAPATPVETLLDFFRRAREKLPFVFLGNVATEDGNHSTCPSCGEIWVERRGYLTRVCVSSANCRCGAAIAIPGIVRETA